MQRCNDWCIQYNTRKRQMVSLWILRPSTGRREPNRYECGCVRWTGRSAMQSMTTIVTQKSPRSCCSRRLIGESELVGAVAVAVAVAIAIAMCRNWHSSHGCTSVLGYKYRDYHSIRRAGRARQLEWTQDRPRTRRSNNVISQHMESDVRL